MARTYHAKGFDLDMRELVTFADRLEALPKKKQKERKAFIRKQGSALRRATVKEANSRVRKTAVVRTSWTRSAGQFHKSIKRGRYYKYMNRNDCIRVYTSDKIGHLIESGWTPVLRNKSKGNKQAGKEVFESAANSFRPKFEKACEEIAVGYKADIES